MNELVLRDGCAVYPRAEGGCNVVLATPVLVYRIPLTPEEKLKLVSELSLSDEEIVQLQRRREAQAQAPDRIIVPSAISQNGQAMPGQMN